MSEVMSPEVMSEVMPEQDVSKEKEVALDGIMYVEQIKVGNRYRTSEDTPDEDSKLKQSISEHGLLQPVVVDREGNLLAGFRRLQKCKAMGWRIIPVRVMPFVKGRVGALQIEHDENVLRKPFSPTELVRLVDDIRSLIEQGEIPRDPTTPIREQAVNAAGTSVGEYTRTKEVLQSGDTEVIEKLEKGEVKSHAAVNEVRKKVGKGGRPKKKVPAKPREVKDDKGQTVPGHLKDLFADLAHKEACAMLDRAHIVLSACAKTNKFITHEHLQKVKDVRNLFQDLLPYALCPAPGCEGKGCPECQHQGWMPAWLYTDFMSR